MTLDKLIKQPAFVIILRCLHTRGEDQRIALEALRARGLWLSEDQKIAAGISA